MKNKIIAAAFTALFVSIVIYWSSFSAPGGAESSTAFTVTSDMSISFIAHKLEEQNLIRSANAFRFLATVRRVRVIPNGRYQLSANYNLQETLERLAHPNKETIKVTIPEGYTIKQIDEKLTEMGLISAGEFSAASIGMEGYLFPDTYFVYNFDFDVTDLVSKMKNNFEKKITADISEAAKKQNRSMEDIIKMASIIEKEVRTEKDYEVVSGILWKRIDSGWLLQADATLLYGKTSNIITRGDIENEDNPYNSRIYKGLPPTPINNPGLRSIRAAAFPKSSPYWFYLTDSDGAVHYAITNDEHNVNRQKYIR